MGKGARGKRKRDMGEKPQNKIKNSIRNASKITQE